MGRGLSTPQTSTGGRASNDHFWEANNDHRAYRSGAHGALPGARCAPGAELAMTTNQITLGLGWPGLSRPSEPYRCSLRRDDSEHAGARNHRAGSHAFNASGGSASSKAPTSPAARRVIVVDRIGKGCRSLRLFTSVHKVSNVVRYFVTQDRWLVQLARFLQ